MGEFPRTAALQRARCLYPQDQLIALRHQNTLAEATAPVAAGLELSALRFR